MLGLCNDLIEWSDVDQGGTWSSANKSSTPTGSDGRKSLKKTPVAMESSSGSFTAVHLYQDDIQHC